MAKPKKIIGRSTAQPATPPELLHIQKLVAQRKFREAEPLANAAAIAYPKFTIVHMLLGAILAENRNIPAAIKRFEKAIKLNPANIDAYVNIAIAQTQNGDYVAAEKTLRRAIAVNPAYAKIYDLLAVVLDNLGEYENAVAMHRKAIQLEPKNVKYRTNLLSFLEAANQLDELELTLEQTKILFPASTVIPYFEGVIAFRRGRSEEAVGLLGSVRFDTPPLIIPTMEKTRLNTLGKAHDKLGNFPKAFQYFRKMNEILAQDAKRQGFSPEAYIARSAEMLGYAQTGQFNLWKPIEGPDDASPVFLIGFPRSGTTLLDSILRSHPNISVVEEKQATWNMRHKLFTMPGDLGANLANMTDGVRETLRKVYFDELNKYVKNKDSVVIDKLPLNINQMTIICRVFPKARFILTVRHPIDAVLSNFMQSFRQNSAMSVMNKLGTAAQLYDLIMRIWVANLPLVDDRFVISKYEDLIADIESTVNPTLALLGLDWHPNMENYRQTALDRGRIHTPSYSQVVQPLYDSAKFRWKKYRPEIDTVIPLLREWVDYFGYPSVDD